MQTYETFEKDLQKYTQYESAVLEALLERVPDRDAATREIVLMVRSLFFTSETSGHLHPCLHLDTLLGQHVLYNLSAETSHHTDGECGEKSRDRHRRMVVFGR